MKFSCYIANKKLYTPIINIVIFVIIIFLFIQSNTVITSISTTVSLFIYKLLPSLYIYIFITELLINFGLADNLAFGIDKILSRIFNIPHHSSSCVIIGFLLGYPNSAKYILKLYNENKITQSQATKLASFTSNANPAYILGTIGIGMFNNIKIGIILLLSHFISAIIIGMLYNPNNSKNIIQQTFLNSNSFKKIYTPFETLYKSIFGTLKTLALIFSYTIIFSLVPIIITNLVHVSKISSALITGITEISNGINLVVNTNISFCTQIVIISFILSFSSLMVIMQIYSFVKKAHVKLSTLLRFKLLQGFISSLLTWILIRFMNFGAVNVFSNTYIQKASFCNIYVFYTICFFTILTILYLLFHRKKRQYILSLKKGDSH